MNGAGNLQWSIKVYVKILCIYACGLTVTFQCVFQFISHGEGL